VELGCLVVRHVSSLRRVASGRECGRAPGVTVARRSRSWSATKM
jgi:hypothetical protein